jgi:formate dehydrogenase subunit gamma
MGKPNLSSSLGPHLLPGRLVLCALLLLPFLTFLGLATTGTVQAAGAEEVNPRAEYWREVRQGDEGYTSATGPFTTNVLIQNGGETWRELRNGPVASIGAWVLAGVLALIVLFHFLVGPHRLEQAPSGDRVPRWTVGERILHWYVAILFIVLAITGLSLLFGRAVLIPVFGLEGFSAYALVAKAAHNYLGPFFLAGVLIEVVVWMRFNIFNREDLHWLRKLGGMFSGSHVHAGRANGGEKIWFWFIAIIGLIGVGVSGVILDFPLFGLDRGSMQLASLVHAVFGMLWIAISFGHIYLGTLGTPGGLEGMVQGDVSKEWMQTHHDRWYQRLEREGRVRSTGDITAQQGDSGRASGAGTRTAE